MTMDQSQFTLKTSGPGLYEFTHDVERFVDEAGMAAGLLTLFCQHTSCSQLLQENADPEVQVDMLSFFSKLVPPADDASKRYLIHRLEGPDDMPAHIKAALTQVHLSIPIVGGRLALGTWQGIYLFEHRTAPHTRRIVGHISS